MLVQDLEVNIDILINLDLMNEILFGILIITLDYIPDVNDDINILNYKEQYVMVMKNSLIVIIESDYLFHIYCILLIINLNLLIRNVIQITDFDT